MTSSRLPVRLAMTSVDGDPARPCVRLERGERAAVAEIARGGDRYGSVAGATLDALGQLLPPVVSLELQQIHLVGDEVQVLVVVVTMSVAGVGLDHAGSAILGDHPEEAAAKATLDAVNRRLEVLEY